VRVKVMDPLVLDMERPDALLLSDVAFTIIVHPGLALATRTVRTVGRGLLMTFAETVIATPGG